MSSIYRPLDKVQSKTSAYDRLSAWLTALVLLVGFLVATLFLIWLTSVFNFDDRVAAGFEPSPPGVDGNEKPEGFEDDALDPGVEDFAEVETPQLAEALEAVSNAVSTIRANSEVVSGTAVAMGTGSGFGSRDGGPSGTGVGIPDYDRWKIVYEVDGQDTYKKQLDFFNIQIGVVSSQQGGPIWRLSNLSSGVQVTETSREKEKKSLRFSHAKQRMKKWDQQIARSQGISIDGKAMVQFYPEDTRRKIAQVEDAYLKSVGKTLDEVRKTNLKVEASGSGFVFTVASCVYR
jgi:hypothetical protein